MAKQDWSPREDPMQKALSHWPRLVQLVKSYHDEARPILDDILKKPRKTERQLKLQLDDILWLVEGDYEHERLSFEQDDLWKEAWAALTEFPGEE